MEPANEKIYTSPQRKLVKFFERSRDRWKAKSRAAKTVLKRLGTRLGRLERSNAGYPQQLTAPQTQVAEWQANNEQAGRGVEGLEKKYPQNPPDGEREGEWGGGAVRSYIQCRR